MNRVPLIITIFISLTLGFSCSPTQKYLKKKGVSIAEDTQYVRVLLLKTRDIITLSSQKRIRITDLRDNKILYDAPSGTIKVTAEKVATRIMVESWDSPISVQDVTYRGSIEITNMLGSLFVINVIKLEDYLKSVVPSEIPAAWPMEALKAQAVAARTYTCYHLGNKSGEKSIFDLDATTNFQVYKGISVENDSTSEAVEKTNGEIIVSNYQPIVAYFHSTCGGRTCDDRYVWTGTDLPYLNSVRCGYCEQSPSFNWTAEISIDEIRHYLATRYKNTGTVKNVAFYKKDGRVVRVKVKHSSGTLDLTGNEFRLLFPPKMIKSLYFTSLKHGNGLKLKGHGWGHGVGLCQWGSRGLAESGMSYKKILRYYYTGTQIARLDRISKSKYASK